MRKNSLMELKIMPGENGGYSVFLDEKKLHHVTGYRIDSTSAPGIVKLELEIMVKFPDRDVEDGMQ